MRDRCQGTLKYAYGSPCERSATRDGYCAQHHPDAVRARAIAKRDKMLARTAAYEEGAELERQDRKDAAAYRALQSAGADVHAAWELYTASVGSYNIAFNRNKLIAALDRAFPGKTWSHG